MALKDSEYSSDELWSERPSRLEHRFLVLRKLGQGTYGKVQLALNKETNQEVAIKTIKKAKIENAEDMLRIRREIHIMTSIQHPHIIHIYEVFETRQKIVIVMQYASGGELYDYLGCHQILPEDEARRIFRQIASAVYYCHKNQICHRDLKLENILLDENGNAQIADFGLSNIFDEKRRMNTFCGSPLYASPEIVKGTPYKGPEVDCWSLGVLLYTLIYGTMPFDGRNFKELVSQISEGRYEEPINKSNASGLIRRLLTPDIGKRATITHVCQDAWVNYGYETSLLELAESMVSKARMQKERLKIAKLGLKTNTKNEHEKSVFRKVDTQLPQEKRRVSSAYANTYENFANSIVNHQLLRPSLYEQITNYDIRFIVNKLITSVEAALLNLSVETEPQHEVPSTNDNAWSLRNLRQKNGEATVADKVNSEYVIPIFEVTSIVPKSIDCSENNQNWKKSSKTCTVQKKIAIRVENEEEEKISDNCIELQHENKNASDTSEMIFYRTKESEVREVSSNESYSESTNTLKKVCYPSGKTLLRSSQKKFNSNVVSSETDSNRWDSNNKLINDNESALSRRPSPKPKRVNNSHFAGQKHLGPFFRSKNHVLSLARMLSVNYEKLVRNSFRIKKRERKPPGKIAIPTTFDPNISTNTIIEKKQIVLFPTVSVSENKEKIEKKIEKIKKAALNMNLILRSNSKNRIKIDKYLRSQAKQMQDLVSDEQRNRNSSSEHFKRQIFTKMSEMCFCMVENRNLNSCLSKKQKDEVFCLLCPKSKDQNQDSDLQHDVNKEKSDFSQLPILENFKQCHICSIKKALKEQESNLALPLLTKSRSEIKFPISDINYALARCNVTELRKQLSKKISRTTPTSDTNILLLNTASVNNFDYTKFEITRSSSDSTALNSVEKAFVNAMNETEVCTKLNKLRNKNSSSENETQWLENSVLDVSNEHSTCKNSENKAIFSLCNNLEILRKGLPIGNAEENFQKCHNRHKNGSDQNVIISRSRSSHHYMNFISNSFHGSEKLQLKRLSSEPFLNGKCDEKYFHNESINGEDTNISSITPGSDKEINERKRGKSRETRRNTIANINADLEKIKCLHDEEFENYIWKMYKGQEFLHTEPQTETCFFSSPNLNHFLLEAKFYRENNTSKSMDHLTLGSKYSSSAYLSPSELEPGETNVTDVRKTSKYPRQEKSLYERSPTSRNRTKSISDETLMENGKNDVFHKLKSERKFSLPQGNVLNENNDRKMPFLSDFVNDLERRDQIFKVADKSFPAHRHLSRNSFSLGRRSKSGYNSKSFLQLLSLKRIQEAEKELDRSERNEINNAEEENPGSLLEALKIHGYKNVISQRFQGPEFDSTDPFLKYPPATFALRNLRSPSRINFTHYNTLPRYLTNSYNELDDISAFNGASASPAYEILPEWRQKSSKQYIYDWLSGNQDNNPISPFSADRNSLSLPDENIFNNEIGKGSTQRDKENASSFDKETTPDSLDTSEELPNNLAANVGSKTRDCLNEPGSYSHSEKMRLFNSSTSTDDEREESVQDRIWRKSFYSRFNNSALSRKERAMFLDSNSLSESRAGFMSSLYNPSKKVGLERTESISLDDTDSNIFRRKRINAAKKYAESFDKFPSNSPGKSKATKTSRNENTAEKTSANLEISATNIQNSNSEMQDSEPEH